MRNLNGSILEVFTICLQKTINESKERDRLFRGVYVDFCLKCIRIAVVAMDLLELIASV